MKIQEDLYNLAFQIEFLPSSPEQTKACTLLGLVRDQLNGYQLKAPSGLIFQDIAEFHQKFGFDKAPFSKEQLRGRIDFIQEELNELKEAFDNKDCEGIVDALEDIIVVAAGTLDRAKADGQKGWIEVMSANMQKEVGTNEKRPNSQGIDLIKPEGWRAPNHSKNLGTLPEIINEEYDFKYAQSYENHPRMIVEVSTRTYSQNEVSQRRRYAINFLEECKKFMLQKASDYNNELSSVKSAHYYERGADDMLFNIREKYLRITSVLDVMRNGGKPNFDTLNDSFRDLAIFAAMFAEWCAGQMDGQAQDKDIFNRPLVKGEK